MKECKSTSVYVCVLDRLMHTVFAFPVNLLWTEQGLTTHSCRKFFFSIPSLYYRNGLGPASCITIMFRYALLTCATSSLVVNTDCLSNLWERLDPRTVWYIAQVTLLYLEQPQKKWIGPICKAARQVHRKMCWTNLSTGYELRWSCVRPFVKHGQNHNFSFDWLW